MSALARYIIIAIKKLNIAPFITVPSIDDRKLFTIAEEKNIRDYFKINVIRIVR